MSFDPNNPIMQLCAAGMEKEGKGDSEAAALLFTQAWNEATNDFEKFTAAHYVARQQASIADKLHWDITALNLALKINTAPIRESLPSLYLNIAKCYEDMQDLTNARTHYQLAKEHAAYLPDNGYGAMIKSGIQKGMERIG